MQVALQNIFDYHLLYHCTINPSFSLNFKNKMSPFLHHKYRYCLKSRNSMGRKMFYKNLNILSKFICRKLKCHFHTNKLIHSILVLNLILLPTISAHYWFQIVYCIMESLPHIRNFRIYCTCNNTTDQLKIINFTTQEMHIYSSIL